MRVDEANVKLQFGDVNAKCQFYHGGELLFVESDGGAGQTCEYKLCSE